VLDLEEWVEPTTGITFRHIPDGCFYPGSPPNEKGRSSIENQGEEICLDSFWMSNTEITRDQWARLISDGRGVLGDKKPVTGQTWQHIQTFIYKLNDIYAGTRRFGLAKELQWEYACRGISNGGRNEPARYWEKAGLSKPCEFETISWNAEGCKILSPPTGPEKVGSHKPNGFGLYDMLGNVAEWTRDPLMPYQRKAGAQMLNVSSNRVVRGGRWNSSDPVNIRCALREKMHQNDTSESIGFRLVSEER
jgi:sulfatase modifying factor 1